MAAMSSSSGPSAEPVVVRATPLPSRVVEHFVSIWEGDEGSARFLHEGTNSTFEFSARGDALILRVHHTGDRTQDDVFAELDWVAFLHGHGVTVAQPIVAPSGDWVQTIEWEGKTVHAAVFRKAPGEHPELGDRSGWNRRLIRRIGRTLGRMHALNRRYQPRAASRRFDWPSIDLPRYAEGITPPEDAAYLTNLKAYWQWIQSLPRDDVGAFGLVHGDFQSANLLVRRSRATVIDFDGSCYNWYLYDIAQFVGMAVLNAGSQDEEKQRAGARRIFAELIRGYVKENPMTSAWFELFPGFLRGFPLLYYFNLLANFQFESEKRKQAPHYEIVRPCVLDGRPFLDLDFKQLHQEVTSGLYARLFRD
jgi:Ser/Thr protein kinase RdoA (MazF antagonist)